MTSRSLWAITVLSLLIRLLITMAWPEHTSLAGHAWCGGCLVGMHFGFWTKRG